MATNGPFAAAGGLTSRARRFRIPRLPCRWRDRTIRECRSKTVTIYRYPGDNYPTRSWYKNGIMNPTPAPAPNANKALWEKGDFTEIAAFMRESGDAFAQSLGITRGMHVLDLGCGDGTTALPIARLGADVTGIDIARNLVEAGNQRAAAAGLGNLKFQEGDASNLQAVADHSFDLTVSMFGAMFAPRPFDVAKEMVRVTKPGGRIVMGNWIAGDPTFVSQLLKISASFLPPPPEGFISPVTWGVDSNVIERFGQAGVPREKISAAKETWHFTSSDRGANDFMEVFQKFYGPTMNAVDAAEKSGRLEELRYQLMQLAQTQNTNKDGGTHVAATFLRVTVQL